MCVSGLPQTGHVTLSIMYPQAAVTFWALALLCAGLRYVLDAHWPSDVLGGIALGYGAAHLTWWGLQSLAAHRGSFGAFGG